jgi:hypothetical protein
LIDKCSDGLLNQDEVVVDCGGVCGSRCTIEELNESFEKRILGYWFLFDETRFSDRGGRYRLTVTNPEGVGVRRYVEDESQGQVDYIRYTVLGVRDGMLVLQVWVDDEVEVPSYGKLLMVGGVDCTQDEFCYRTYSGYNISLVDRENQRYRIVLPDGAFSLIELNTETMNSPDNNLGLKTLKQYVQGGYSIIHVWAIPDALVGNQTDIGLINIGDNIFL